MCNVVLKWSIFMLLVVGGIVIMFSNIIIFMYEDYP